MKIRFRPTFSFFSMGLSFSRTVRFSTILSIALSPAMDFPWVFLRAKYRQLDM